MKRNVFALVVISYIIATTACSTNTAGPVTAEPPQASLPTEVVPASTAASEIDPVSPVVTESVAPSTVPSLNDDYFTQNGILPPVPVCTALTQAQTEGPYYTPDTPERNSLLEAGMPGTRLILVGYVLDQNCNPLPNAWLDFWQADANGEYDNAGYRLRGHQFSDEQGRYYLETIVPGLYSSRPIEHIHVKVRPEGGAEVTSQLYFPSQPIEGLTITIEDKDEFLLGYFNFVVQK